MRRQQRGPPGPEQAPATEVLLCRRYLCTGCGAVLTVLPASAQARKHFSGAAIALALTLWGLCGYSAAQVRAVVSDWVHTGAAARGWRSLHEASQGAHRELGRLSSLCLREAARRKRKLVDSDIARGVLDRQVSSS